MEVYLISLVIGYFLGSIPFAVVVARFYKVNILKEGSSNPGATNVVRVLGFKPGLMVFLLDMLKGAFSAGFVSLFMNIAQHDPFLVGITGLVGAVLGHSFSLFLKFKGGKGVAVTIGALLYLMPLVVLLGGLFWIVFFYLSRYVSLASISFGVSLPILTYFLKDSDWAYYFSWGIALFILIRHHSNIKRLMTGKENRFGKK